MSKAEKKWPIPPTPTELAALAKCKATEDAPDSAPLTEDESDVFNSIVKHIGEEMKNSLEDETIIRFVRGYQFEKKDGKANWIKVATEELDKNIKWRQEVEASTLSVRKLPKQELFRDSWKTGVFGVDRQGHPIICESVLGYDMDVISKNFEVEELGLYAAQNVEICQDGKMAISKALGKMIYKHVYIIDLQGLSKSHFVARDFIKPIIHIGQAYYPECMRKMFLLNAPVLFRMLWALIKVWIHPLTSEKIHIIGSDFWGELEANGIDRDQIPEFLGGTYGKSS